VRTRRQRNADVKLLVAATVAVLLTGFLVALAFLVAANSGGSRATCGRLPVGTADGVRNDLETGGPYFQTGGARCGFWLALDDGDIVAYRADQPGDCALRLEREQLACGGRPVDVTALEQFPVSLETRDEIDTVIVDTNPDATPSSTSSTSAPGGD
jgi:hypothetical protein